MKRTKERGSLKIVKKPGMKNQFMLISLLLFDKMGKKATFVWVARFLGVEALVDQQLTHFNEQQRAKMVDVSDKKETKRTAVAKTAVMMKPETMQRIKEGQVGKGDVLAVAQVAGIMAAKKTPEWIPMCHPLQLTGIDLSFSDNGHDTLYIEARVKTVGVTGVEMEALTAVSAAALTVYDMCKAMDRDMSIGPTYLQSKRGGKSGDYVRGNGG